MNKTIYDFTVKNTDGQEMSLKDYQGKVLLIVNTATRCGLTPQYSALESLYEKYKDQGFVVLDFPCNQFLEQAPEDNAGIQKFCETHYGTTFPRFDKIEVNGENENPLYQFLKTCLPEDEGGSTFKEFLIKLASLGQKREGSDIKWNFTKFLIDKNGVPVHRFAPTVTPNEIETELQKLL